jgi:phosphoribosylaminoimidazolecarboxamide formyltransferase/IMP cyclohydrolase
MGKEASINGEEGLMGFNRVAEISDLVKVNNVIMSVYDKTGLDSLVGTILSTNPRARIFSTGGTYTKLEILLGAQSVGKNLFQVSEYTGQPEMQGGLVKTLDFKIYLGLLAEGGNPDHEADLARTESFRFDMVVSNLYPFAAAVAKPGILPEEARQHIDIGGPCLTRASAKNWLRVASVSDPILYPLVEAELKKTGGSVSLALRRRLALESFSRTAEYDAAIARFLASKGDSFFLKGYSVK